MYWPGNVRELEHLIGRSALRALGRQSPRPRIVTLEAAGLDLPAARATPAPDGATPADGAAPAAADQGLREQVEAFERRLVRQCLERHDYKWAAAARELRIDRANLARLARRLGLEAG